MQSSLKRAGYQENWLQFLKVVAAIAVPVAFQNLLTATGSMVDTLMLAKLNENAKGAVGLCSKYANLLCSGYWGFVGGGMLFMNQYWGAEDHKGFCRSFGLMFSFIMLVAVVFSGFAAFAPSFVMKLLTDKEEYWEIGAQYLRIASLAYIFQSLTIAFSSMLRSMERVRLPLAASIVSLVVNIFVNYTLIFGHFGFPALGIRGAAIGTVVSAAINLIVILVLSAVLKYPLVFKIQDHFKWSAAFVKLYLVKSFPIILNEVLIGIANFVIGIILGRQSTEMINALAILNVFEGFVIAFFSGFTNASSILVGKEVGAGNHDIAFGRAKRLTLLTPVVVLSACLIILLFHQPLLASQGFQGESFVIARGLLTIFTLVATIRMGNWIQNDTFRAAGDPVTGTVLEILFMYLMVIPSAVLSGIVWKWPPLVVFACCYVDEPFRIVLMLRHLFSGRWIRPVTREGLATIDAFREKHGIVMKSSVWKKKA